ncbi:MAG TPA: hypothetical protein VJK02_25490 [Anaerolineales bacterium]|nr:hypothetical protein [Anaerolineales bacterium]
MIAENGRKVNTYLLPIRDGRPGELRRDLPAGSYLVDVNHAGIDSAAGLPAKVEILAGQTSRLDVDIDTGIRQAHAAGSHPVQA